MESQDELIGVLIYGIIFIVIITAGLMMFFHYSRKKIVQEQVAKIELQLENQKSIVKTIIATQEEERKRIAQDLHDAISAKLNVVSLTTNMLLYEDTITNEQKKSLEHILDVTMSTLESSRSIAHNLLPPVLEKFGLKAALDELVEDFLKTNKIQVHHIISDTPELSDDKKLHVFRIVQELFNNAIRHGEATQVILELIAVKPGFELLFSDNGKGFDTNDMSQISGLGLQNIQSRVEILHATLSVESTIDKGSVFKIKSILND